MGIVRFIIGLLTFVIGVAVVKFVLWIIATGLHLLWAAMVIGFFLLLGWIVYKVIFPKHPANA